MYKTYCGKDDLALHLSDRGETMSLLRTLGVQTMNPPPREYGEVSAVPRSLEKVLYFLLDSVTAEVTEVVSEALSKFKIMPRHYAILCVLEDAQKNQQDLAAEIRVNRNAMVQLIDQLEELNMVKRETNPLNRREHKISLTDKGRKVLAESSKKVTEAHIASVSSLTENERTQLMAMLNKVLNSKTT